MQNVLIRQRYNKLFTTANAEASIFAIRTTIGMLAATFLALFFQFSAPYWAVITVIMLMNSYAGLAVQKGVYRVIATIAGAIIALILARYVDDIYTLLSVTLITICIFQYLSAVSSYRYVFLLCGVTIFLVLGSIVSGPEVPVQMAIWRCAEIILGVIIVSTIAVCVLPKDPGYWLHSEVLNYFNYYKDLYSLIISPSISDISAVENTKQLTNLSTVLAKIKTYYDAYCQEPSRDLSHVNAMNELISTLKKMQNVLKLMSITFTNKTEYYWVTLFKEDIEKMAKCIEAIFLQLSKTKQHNIKFDSNLFSFAQDAVDEMKKKVAILRKTHEIQNYAIFDNQSLYVFLIHQQQLIDTLKVFTTKTQFDLQVIDKFQFSKIISFKRDPIIIRHSIKTALACTLAMFIWIWGGWPGGLQGIVSAIVIATNIYINDMWQTSLRRLMGCALGGAVGLISLHFLIYNILDLLIIVFAVGFVFSFYTNRSKKYSYIALQANFAFALTLIQAGGPTDSILAPLGRLSGIALGIFAMMVINYFIWPLNAKKMLLKKVQALAKNFSDMLNQAKKTFLQGEFSKDIVRCQAELAECKDLYSSISTTLDSAVPAENAVNRQLDEFDFALIHLNVIIQYADLPQALEIAEKININLKAIMLQTLALLQSHITDPKAVKQENFDAFQELVLSEYQHVRQSKKNFDYSLEAIANFSYVIYQLRLLVEDIKSRV